MRRWGPCRQSTRQPGMPAPGSPAPRLPASPLTQSPMEEIVSGECRDLNSFWKSAFWQVMAFWMEMGALSNDSCLECRIKMFSAQTPSNDLDLKQPGPSHLPPADVPGGFTCPIGTAAQTWPAGLPRTMTEN